MKKILILVILALFFATTWAQKTYVMHYLPILNHNQAESYTGYDGIVVDHEVINTSASELNYMRSVNPRLKILVYVEKMQWHMPMFPDKPWSIWMTETLKKYPRWFLLNPEGKNLSFWPGTVMMDCRANGYRYGNYNYIEFFTKHYISEILGAYLKADIKVDGILDDDLMKEISFLSGGVDANRDGVEDESEELNRQWRLGNAYFLKKVRQVMGPDFLIIGNGGHGYYMDYCQGKQMENFPEIYIGDWTKNMTNAAGMKIAFFNARTGEKDNWMFAVCSAMLLDNTWFSQGQNTPYDKKYDLQLGSTKGPFYQNQGQVFLREFQNGTIHVDPINEEAWITK